MIEELIQNEFNDNKRSDISINHTNNIQEKIDKLLNKCKNKLYQKEIYNNKKMKTKKTDFYNKDRNTKNDINWLKQLKKEKEEEDLKEKPTINKNSKKIFYTKNEKYIPLHNRVDNVIKVKNEKLLKIKNKYDKKNENDNKCTFKPKINKTPIKNYKSIINNIDTIIQNKNKNLEQLKIKKNNNDKENCTFSPLINKNYKVVNKIKVEDRLNNKFNDYKVNKNLIKKEFHKVECSFKPKWNKSNNKTNNKTTKKNLNNYKKSRPKSFLKNNNELDYKPSINFLYN